MFKMCEVHANNIETSWFYLQENILGVYYKDKPVNDVSNAVDVNSKTRRTCKPTVCDVLGYETWQQRLMSKASDTASPYGRSL
jgi:hypothetical protein